MRRFEDMKPVRRRTSLFALSWTIMHRIDAHQPALRHDAPMPVRAADGNRGDAERHRTRPWPTASMPAIPMPPEDIVWDHKFVDVLSVTPARAARGRFDALPRHRAAGLTARLERRTVGRYGPPAMEKFNKLTGVAAPLPMINVDTDMIIPKQFLKTIKRTGLGSALFHEMRTQADGSENPDFVLNKPAYKKAQILVTGANFGCGSSREHAPWALLDFGIRVRDRAELRRHLLQQLLQERHPADRAAAGRHRQADGRCRARRQRGDLGRSGEAGDPRARTAAASNSTSIRSASNA